MSLRVIRVKDQTLTIKPLPLVHISQPPRVPPPAGTRPPLLLLLHGVGSHEGDLFQLAPRLDGRFHVLSLRAPHSLAPGSYAWFEVRFTPEPVIRPDMAEASRQSLIESIAQAPAHYRADPQRVYLLGFSQGAIMSLALALTRPDLLAGAVAISGRTLPELFQPEGPLGGHLAPLEQLDGLPLFVLHGAQDTTLPVKHGRATRDRFALLPVDLTYREYDMPHALSEASLRDAAAWLTTRLDGASR